MLTFEQWMNRPVYKAQVFTARMFHQLIKIDESNQHLALFRVLPAYRTAAILEARKQVATHVRKLRKGGNFKLPTVNPYA